MLCCWQYTEHTDSAISHKFPQRSYTQFYRWTLVSQTRIHTATQHRAPKQCDKRAFSIPSTFPNAATTSRTVLSVCARSSTIPNMDAMGNSQSTFDGGCLRWRWRLFTSGDVEHQQPDDETLDKHHGGRHYLSHTHRTSTYAGAHTLAIGIKIEYIIQILCISARKTTATKRPTESRHERTVRTLAKFGLFNTGSLRLE